MPLTLALTDITLLHVDAIVNAANPQLSPGGGVSGAIHHAAGPDLALACAAYVREHGPVPTGGAAITPGFELPARFVIHAVGPIWRGGDGGEESALVSAYRACVALAEENDLASIAFPSISTGIYGYPLALAAPVAVRAVADSLASVTHVTDAMFALFDDPTLRAYQAALASIAGLEDVEPCESR